MVLWVANRKVYGAHKLWKAARRAGHDIGRDQIARLMRELEIEGVSRRRQQGVHHHRRSRRGAGTGPREPELHRRPPRRLVGHRPDLRADQDGDGLCVLHRRRVLPTHRRVAGRVAHAHRHGPRRARDGPTIARWPPPDRARDTRGCRVSQFTSVRFTERLDEIGARPSIGTVADSYDNALAETTNGLYKTECVYGPDAPRPWDDVDQLELATLSWVHWFNDDRLHGHCDDVPPAEFEAAFYAAQQTAPTGVGNQ